MWHKPGCGGSPCLLRMQAMKDALSAAQEALKTSRAEASSRLASVKELQEKLAAQPPDQTQVCLHCTALAACSAADAPGLHFSPQPPWKQVCPQ